jgi:hypothetical protein
VATLLSALPQGVSAVLAVAKLIVEENASKTGRQVTGVRKIMSIISQLKPEKSDLPALRKFRDEVTALQSLKDEIGSFIWQTKIKLGLV